MNFARTSARIVDHAMCAMMFAIQQRHRLTRHSRRQLEEYIAAHEGLSRDAYFAAPPVDITQHSTLNGQLSWPSPIMTGVRANDRTRVELFPSEHRWTRPTVIFLHALMSASDLGYRRWAARFNEQGWNACFVHLPFHYSRRPRGRLNGELAITPDLVRTAEGLRQGVSEVRQLLEILRGWGCREFGLMALSYGGWIGALLASVEQDFRWIGLLEPIVDVEHAIWVAPMGLALRRELRRVGVEAELIARHFPLESPLHGAPHGTADRVIFCAGEYDEIARLEDVRRLHERWQGSEMLRLPQGHFGYGMMRAVWESFAGEGLDLKASASPLRSSAWRVLRNGPFARYMSGELISMLGTWMQQMALGWVVTALTASAFTLGLINLASGLPMLALTMWGGVVADRLDKRRILLATLVVQALIAVAIGLLVAWQQITVWHIALAGVCLGISTAFEMPAAAALVPELVAKDEIGAAIAVDRSIFHATRLGGPALGGWLIGWLGTASAFYANALSFGALMLALLTIHPRPRGTDEQEEMRQTGMKEGLAYVRGDHPTRNMILLLMIGTVCISPFFMILMPLYSRHVLHVGAREHGLLMASSGFGAFVGSIWLLSIAAHRRINYLYFAVAVIVLAMTGLAVAQQLSWAIAAMIVLTVGTSTMFGLSNTIVQERAPDYLRGRVSAIFGLSFFGVLPFSGLLMSKFADIVGLRVAMGTSAAGFGLAATVLFYTQRREAAQTLHPTGHSSSTEGE